MNPRDELIRPYDHQRASLAVNPAMIEDVAAGLEVGAKRLFIVDQPEAALGRQSQIEQVV